MFVALVTVAIAFAAVLLVGRFGEDAASQGDEGGSDVAGAVGASFAAAAEKAGAEGADADGQDGQDGKSAPPPASGEDGKPKATLTQDPTPPKVKAQLEGLLAKYPDLAKDPNAIAEITRWHDGFEKAGTLEKQQGDVDSLKAQAGMSRESAYAIGDTWGQLYDQDPKRFLQELKRLHGDDKDAAAEPAGDDGQKLDPRVEQLIRDSEASKRQVANEASVKEINGRFDEAVKALGDLSPAHAAAVRAAAELPLRCSQEPDLTAGQLVETVNATLVAFAEEVRGQVKAELLKAGGATAKVVKPGNPKPKDGDAPADVTDDKPVAEQVGSAFRRAVDATAAKDEGTA